MERGAARLEVRRSVKVQLIPRGRQGLSSSETCGMVSETLHYCLGSAGGLGIINDTDANRPDTDLSWRESFQPIPLLARAQPHQSPRPLAPHLDDFPLSSFSKPHLLRTLLRVYQT